MMLGNSEVKVDSNNLSEEINVSSLLQAAFDSTETVRFIVDSQGNVLHFNRKAFENSILIHSKELKKGDNLFDFASDTNNKVQNHLKIQLARVFAGETFSVEHEVKYKGFSRWFQSEYAPILKNRKIIAASLSTLDISERKLAELKNAQLLAEVKATSQHRIHQIEFSLDAIINRDEELISSFTKSEEKITIRLARLFRDLIALRGKLHSWKQ